MLEFRKGKASGLVVTGGVRNCGVSRLQLGERRGFDGLCTPASRCQVERVKGRYAGLPASAQLPHESREQQGGPVGLAYQSNGRQREPGDRGVHGAAIARADLVQTDAGGTSA